MKKRKILVLLLVAFLLISITACGSNKEEVKKDDAEEAGAEESEEQAEDKDENDISEESVDAESESGNTIVIYFSATGTTKGVAEKIAALTNADTYAIVPAEEYTEADLDWHDDNSRTSIEQNNPEARPEIASEAISLDEYDTVFIGYPIWWGQAPKIMYTFVEGYDFDGKTVIPFCTSGSSGIGSSGENLSEAAGSGNWLGGNRFSASTTEDEIKAWVEKTQKDREEVIMRIDEIEVPVIWENNESVSELMEFAKDGLSISMSSYGGFEQVGSIGTSITRNDLQITTSPGDIVLYSGNQIVIFYGSNSWAYTKLGRIDLSQEELTELLGNGDVTVTLKEE